MGAGLRRGPGRRRRPGPGIRELPDPAPDRFDRPGCAGSERRRLRRRGRAPARRPPRRGGVGVLSEGEKAPDFSLPDHSGKQVKLSDLRGETVVLYFYPRADTPGCTTQACGVRDHRAEYEKAGARVIGVSPDEVTAIDKF